jgi:solute carrier family 25 S-adenosylmethionine transporter 26
LALAQHAFQALTRRACALPRRAQVFVHPIDTIKTRLQVSEPPKKLRKWRKKLAKAKNQLIVPVGSHGRTLTVPNWAYKGPGDIYRGVAGAVLGTLPTALVYFTVYDRVSAALEARHAECEGEEAHPSGGRRAATVHLLSAAAGAVASSFVRVPGDTCRHQTQAYMHANVFAAARTIVARGGVRGLYLGYLPTLLRDVPELAVQFTVYEALRRAAQRRRGAAEGCAAGGAATKLATWEHLVLGGAAGAAAATVTMPLDFIKTRQQCGAVGGVSALVRGVIAAEGLPGLFSGLGPRVCHVASTSAVFFGLFEAAKLLLKPERTAADRLLLPKLIRKRRDHVWKRQLVLE